MKWKLSQKTFQHFRFFKFIRFLIGSLEEKHTWWAYPSTVLDNYRGQGVRIVLADQHAAPVLTDHMDWCTIIVRYSNMSLEDMIEFLFLPTVKEGFESVTYDKFGFRDLIGEAMKRKITINLAIMSGTSLLTVGPAGYTEAMSSIFHITQ